MRSGIIFPSVAALFISLFAVASAQKTDPPFLKYINHPWVDSVFTSLSTEEKVAQLIWVAAFANNDLEHEVWLSNQVTSTGIGGIIFFSGKADRQAEMINYLQKISKVPLMVVTDGEWGLGMRLEKVVKFPYQLTMGAVRNDSLIYSMGAAVAGQFKRAGVNINLAPVADLDNNPENPVINFRSFGEDPENAAGKALMYMKGLQDNGIISVAKHFPGHGDTEVDSHFDLPVIRHARARLDTVELVPFRRLIDAGVSGIMPGHLSLPLIDSASGIPATVSYPVLTRLLRNELSFAGLVLSDAMNMKGVTSYTVSGEAEVQALKAGMDVLEYVTDPELTIRTIIAGIKKGEISITGIDEKCRRVLAAKYWAGLNERIETDVKNLENDLSSHSIHALIRELYANALTVLRNENDIIPVKGLDTIRIATLAINNHNLTHFQTRISKYFPADKFFIDPSDTKSADELLKKLAGYNIVLAGVYGTDQRPQTDFGITSQLSSFIGKLVESTKCVITWFGNPYAIDRISSLSESEGLILAYQENQFTEDLSAQLIFGGIGARGSLPVTINETWPCNFGIETPGNLRLQFGFPESAGLYSELLERRIDSVVNIGLTSKAFPGCEVMIARKGIVVFQKTYGYHTYDNRVSLQEDDLFDLASVTKVSSTLAGLLLLNTEGKFSPDKRLGDYLPYFKNSDKGDLQMRDLLAHQAGLTSWIPFWRKTVRNDTALKRSIFRHENSERFSLKVANDLYINRNYREKIFKEIKRSPLGEKKYVYSDLTFIISPEIISTVTGEKWYEYVTKNIYHKIGAYDIGFNPMLRYPLSRIVPTEYDSLFRQQQLHGTVHDEGAAMLGGISGHAGLFATANDLMKLMELYRRMGNYGGEQLISEEVLKEYTRVQFPGNNNRRGLGFDKPLLNNSAIPERDAYPASGVSPESFGHTGYTGTMVWMDPVNEITYVFFSNRVYPTRNNNLLSTLNIRSDILQAIYDAIRK
ncbi:MAG: serine hydrolase [Bacteroidales bacterium]|nr:serine hydrolase [Bacteroidales bacterium]